MNKEILWPKPGGPYKVGFFEGSFEYIRNNVARTVGYRCYYPAEEVSGEPVTYYDDAETAELFRQSIGMSPLSSRIPAIMNLKTNGFRDAAPAKLNTSMKAIIYSHSYGNLPWTNLIQIEELASRGYLVCAVSHTEDACFTSVGSRKIGMDRERHDRIMGELNSCIIRNGKSDMRFWTADEIKACLEGCIMLKERIQIWTDDHVEMMNEVERLNSDPSSILFCKIDSIEYGTFGLSFGGAAALNTPLFDKRVVAAANVDGWQFGNNLNSKKLEIPAVFITETSNHYEGNYGIHNDMIECLEITGSSNSFFSDSCILHEDIVKTTLVPAPTLDGATAANVLTDVLVSFFDRNLKRERAAGFNDLVSKYPRIVALDKPRAYKKP